MVITHFFVHISLVLCFMLQGIYKRLSISRITKIMASSMSSASSSSSSSSTQQAIASPKSMGYRMPAEWESHRQTWMLWPVRFDNWRLEASAARDSWAAVIEAISRFEHVAVGAPSSGDTTGNGVDHVLEARSYLEAKVGVGH